MFNMIRLGFIKIVELVSNLVNGQRFIIWKIDRYLNNQESISSSDNEVGWLEERAKANTEPYIETDSSRSNSEFRIFRDIVDNTLVSCNSLVISSQQRNNNIKVTRGIILCYFIINKITIIVV